MDSTYDTRCLTIITARGGSKGLPGKNIRDLNGKPLLAWTIQAALCATLPQHVVVSTDDARIRTISLQYGAHVPFIRPQELATDTATSMSVVFHTIDFFAQQGLSFEYVMLLQPTSPLRDAQDIDAAYAHMLQSSAPACVSVCEADHSPYLMFLLSATNTLCRLLPEQPSPRRQDLPRAYRTNGAIYIAQTRWLLQTQNFIGAETVAFIMPKSHSVDIDDQDDFERASCYLQHTAHGESR